MKIRLGYADGQFSEGIRYGGDSHLILVSPTRIDKPKDILFPALMGHEGSFIVLDPKGEISALTARRPARKEKRIVVFDPFKTSLPTGEIPRKGGCIK